MGSWQIGDQLVLEEDDLQSRCWFRKNKRSWKQFWLKHVVGNGKKIAKCMVGAQVYVNNTARRNNACFILPTMSRLQQRPQF